MAFWKKIILVVLALAIASPAQALDIDLDSNDAVDIAYGGTNAATAADARANLGLKIGTNIQAYSANLAIYAGLTPSANVQSVLSAATYAAMRALLDLEVGTDFNAYDANLPTWPATVDATEVGYLNGVTSAIQTQLDAKIECPAVTVAIKSSAYTVGTDDSCECYGGVIYVTAAATITMCDNLDVNMAFDVVSHVAGAVVVDPQADDLMWLDGTVNTDGKNATSGSVVGDAMSCTYYNTTGWGCISNGWTPEA